MEIEGAVGEEKKMLVPVKVGAVGAKDIRETLVLEVREILVSVKEENVGWCSRR